MAVPADQVLQVLSLREFHQVLRTCVHKGQSWSHRGICKASGNDNFLVELDSAGGRKGNLRKKKKKVLNSTEKKYTCFLKCLYNLLMGLCTNKSLSEPIARGSEPVMVSGRALLSQRRLLK